VPKGKVKEETLSFTATVALLTKADAIMLVPSDECGGVASLANTVGYAEEGDPRSAFVVGAEHWDDIVLRHRCHTKIVNHQGNVGVVFPKYTVTLVPLYGKKSR
jgi:hypothetical protein